jgi:hypothetical protein
LLRPYGLANGRVGAHISWMASGTQITVHFTCPKCAGGYNAMQEHVTEKSAGRFECINCFAEVYSSIRERWVPLYSLWRSSDPERHACAAPRGLAASANFSIGPSDA